MKSKHLILSAVVALAGFLPQSKAALDLGSADSFAVLGGSAVTSIGSTVINGNLGVSPGTAITGFTFSTIPGPGIVNGANYSGAGSAAGTAQIDAATAYSTLAAESVTLNLTGKILGTVVPTLTPGVYHFDSTAQLTGTLTLNGNSTDRFDFLIGTTFDTASLSSIVLNGVQADNVFWQVGTDATLGAGTLFSGSILAHDSIGLGDGANMFGRALALNGAVTLDNNNITAVPEPNAYLAGFCTIAVFLFGWRNRK